MMVLFFHAARLAMVTFDPYLSSRPLAEALERAPEGDAGRRPPLLHVLLGLLLHESHGVAAERAVQQPGVRVVRAGRAGRLSRRRAMAGAAGWGPKRCYIVADDEQRPRFEKLVGKSALFVLAESGGKMVLTNQPL